MPYDLEKPEGLLGHLLALEGVRDSATMINGPTGCKMYPADLSEKMFRDRGYGAIARNLFTIAGRYHFCQPRLPCTYLDGGTFISGSGGRLGDLYGELLKTKPGLIGVVNSPGASLIGEDLSALGSDVPTVRVESPGFSRPLSEGFQDCAIEVIKALKPVKTGMRHGVCIMGMGIWQHGWEDSIRELRRMLALCDVEVIAAVCAGSSAEEMRGIADSELNLVIYEENGLRIAEHCRETFGTDYLCGMPFGFDSIGAWIEEVCSRLGKDPSKALDDLAFWRRRSAETVSNLDASFVQIGGRSFTMSGEPSFVDAAASFLYDYLGLIPVALSGGDAGRPVPIACRLESRGVEIGDDFWSTPADIAFGSGTEVSALKYNGTVLDGMDISEPSRIHVSITDEPLLGTMGTVMLLQRTLDIVARLHRCRSRRHG